MGPFTHHCYSDAEVAALELKLSEQRSAFNRADGWRFLAGAAIAISMFVTMGVCSSAIDAATNQSSHTPVALYVCLTLMITTLVAFAVCAYRMPPEPDDLSLGALGNDYLKNALEWSQAHPELRKAVATWLRDGKQLRVRDLDAIERYARQADRERERTETLEALKNGASLV
ncbi:hypothetical protein IMW82_13370 [Rhodanobacter sp. B2A1Ga4]|uniref:hypothetical protein n=1 Tax=Rhodanobacter sp. B2A1Ga4 TaxID=2778647 RepID=UPI001B3588C3|nr:hypothetical protein [Rhodanobacter sp. B2A1Ga4]MBQ4855662.1 hypothetical protein [Rhodanobacter sp. B2A1Ga4]